jgi:hypothetical protein
MTWLLQLFLFLFLFAKYREDTMHEDFVYNERGAAMPSNPNIDSD